PHVERLYGGRVVVEDYRLFKMRLYQESLVFTLEISAPLVDDISEFLFLVWVGVFKNVDCLGLSKFFKFIIHHIFQAIDHSQFIAFQLWFRSVFLRSTLIKKIKVLLAVVERI